MPTALGVLALVLPLGAGALAGLLVLRSDSATPVRDAALSGPLAGAAVGLLAWLSGGAAGDARLADLGPSPWQGALAVAVLVAAPASALAWWRTRTPAHEADGPADGPGEGEAEQAAEV